MEPRRYPAKLAAAGAAGLVVAGVSLLRWRARKTARGGRDPLAVYLADHLAGARMAVGLLGALRDRHRDESMGQFADELLAAVEADRQVLRGLVRRFGGRRAGAKQSAAWLAEKATRLKFERRVAGDLGVLQALETLALGIQGKLALWHSVAAVAGTDPRLAGLDVDELASRAEAQHAQVEARRLEYVRRVLAEDRTPGARAAGVMAW